MSFQSQRKSHHSQPKSTQPNEQKKNTTHIIKFIITFTLFLIITLASPNNSPNSPKSTITSTTSWIVEAGFNSYNSYNNNHYHHLTTTHSTKTKFYFLPLFASAAEDNTFKMTSDSKNNNIDNDLNEKEEEESNNIIMDDQLLLIHDMSGDNDDNNNDDDNNDDASQSIQFDNFLNDNDDDDDITTSSSVNKNKNMNDDDLSYGDDVSTTSSLLLVDNENDDVIDDDNSSSASTSSSTSTSSNSNSVIDETAKSTIATTTESIESSTTHSTVVEPVPPTTATIITTGGNTNTNSNTNTPQKVMSSTSHSFSSFSSSSSHSYSSNISKAHTHYIFLVHGYMGNALEMDYIEEALHNAKQSILQNTSTDTNESEFFDHDDVLPPLSSSKQNNKHRIVVHSVTSNNGRTTDGIANGGIRIAQEIQNFIKQDVQLYNNIHDNNESLNDTTIIDDDDDVDTIMDTSTDTTGTGVGNRSRTSSTNSMKKKRNIQHISISFIGNSLGGLYSRFALSCIPQQFEISSITIKLHYNIFCTTVTPHLGVASNTFLKLPRFMEHVIGNVLLSTGRDLFRVDNYETNSGNRGRSDSKSEIKRDGDGSGDFTLFNPLCGEKKESLVDDNDACPTGTPTTYQYQANDLIYKMAVDDSFVQPLMAFRKRIAYINAFGSDFQVPTSTAAFLDEQSTYPHYVIDVNHEDDSFSEPEDHPSTFVIAVTKTETDYDILCAKNEWYQGKSPHLIMSNRLDAMGWYKVFIDTRDRIPLPSFSIRSMFGEKKSYKQLWDEFLNSKKYEPKVHDDGMKVVATVESRDMYAHLVFNDRIQFPAGHSVLVANAKSEGYKEFNAKGRPVMDKLAKDILIDLLDTN